MDAAENQAALFKADRDKVSVLEQLRWKKFPVLDDGFICLVDVMGNDAAVVQAARTSYGNEKRNGDTTVNMSDSQLLRYLMRNRHSTPFEMVEVKFLVRVPMDAWRQWIRHRTANVNEYSTRYAEAIDARQCTPQDAWRLQSTNNKQGSSGAVVTEWPEATDPGTGLGAGEYLTMRERDLHKMTQDVYNERLVFGVAKEVARKDLPLSTYTEAYWKCDLHNIMHFLGLRMDGHAQQEIRNYATTMGDEIIAKLFPITWQAFLDYRINAMYLSAQDKEVLQRIAQHLATAKPSQIDFPLRAETIRMDVWPEGWRTEKCRERDECIAKLRILGFVQ